MELQFLQGEMVSFLRQRQGKVFTKPQIARAVAEHLIETKRSDEPLETLSGEILSELERHRLRDWPRITRQVTCH
jgi:hypothetical protein